MSDPLGPFLGGVGDAAESIGHGVASGASAVGSGASSALGPFFDGWGGANSTMAHTAAPVVQAGVHGAATATGLGGVYGAASSTYAGAKALGLASWKGLALGVGGLVVAAGYVASKLAGASPAGQVTSTVRGKGGQHASTTFVMGRGGKHPVRTMVLIAAILLGGPHLFPGGKVPPLAAPSSLACGQNASAVEVGGMTGVAAAAGHAAHELQTHAPTAVQVKHAVVGGATWAGREVGGLWRTFTTTMNGAPVPRSIPASATQASYGCGGGAGGTCGAGGTLSASFPTSTVPGQPGDSPAMTDVRAAQTAGFTGQDLLIDIAVDGAESGYNRLATNLNSNGTTDYGIGQINSVHAALLARGDWRNPVDNQRMAKVIHDSAGGWTPWSTFNSGAYRQWLPRAQQAIDGVQGVAGPPVQLAEPASNPVAQPAPCGPVGPGAGAVQASFHPGPPAVEAAIRFALAQVGKPYQWGGNGPNSWDCSSLVQASYRAAGIPLGRTTYQQVLDGSPVPVGQVQRGDLVLTEPGHIMLALGNGTVVEAPHTGTLVQVGPLPSQIWAVRRVVSSAFTAA